MLERLAIRMLERMEKGCLRIKIKMLEKMEKECLEEWRKNF